MYRRFWAAIMAFLIVQVTVPVEAIHARPRTERQALLAERVKAGVAELGAGEEARVTVRLKNKSQLSGYVSQIREDCFEVTDLKTGVPTTIAYPDVAKAKGHNLSTGAKIAIGVGVGVGIFLLIFFWYLETHG